MMTKDELQELADDIKANGLREPIKLSADGKMIIDGRNRLAACHLAKIEPEFQKLNGGDSTAYVISANIARRHMTAGQRAMVAATIYPEPAKVGRGQKVCVAQTFPMVDPASLSRARRVICDAPDLVAGVLDGSTSLEKAATQAKERAESASSDENKMALLRDGARDLADLVKENKMNIDEAIAAMRERQRKLRETIEHGKQAAEVGITQFLAAVASILAAAQVTDEKIIDKKRIAATVKAASQLQSISDD